MVTQHPPFLRAEPGDKYYKKIWNGDWESFWEVHSDENLSDDFKDLVTKMLHVDPKDRLSLKGIKNHPWYRGKVPSRLQIFKRFTQRKKTLDESICNKENEHKNDLIARTKSSPKEAKKFYTQFFDVNDGDRLLDILISFANCEGYSSVKSTEFFRVQIVASEMAHET